MRNALELICFEIEYKLLPQLFYDSEEMERMIREGEFDDEAMLDFYMLICDEDKVDCEYAAEDFRVECLTKDDIQIIKIDLPQRIKTKTIYLMSIVMNSKPLMKQYFVIEKEGQAEKLIFVNRKGESKLVDMLPAERTEEEELKFLVESYKRIGLRIFEERSGDIIK